MDFDTHVNLATGTIQTAPTPAISGQTFVLMPGDGQLFAANMPVTLAPAEEQPTYDNAEIGYCTAKSGDTLTILRGQEDVPTKAVAAGWRVYGSITKKTITDLEGAIVANADKHFEQAFTSSSSVTVNHNLGKKPAVTIIDSAGDEVEGTVNHTGVNSLAVSFSAPFSGIVIVN